MRYLIYLVLFVAYTLILIGDFVSHSFSLLCRTGKRLWLKLKIKTSFALPYFIKFLSRSFNWIEKSFYRNKSVGLENLKHVLRYRFQTVYFLIGSFIALAFIIVPIFVYALISDLPNPLLLSQGPLPKTTKLYDRNGELLFEIFVSQNRTVVPLSEIPKSLKQATIAVEDQNFYEHNGFDLQGIGRALYENATTDSRQGGSTLTQQLVKSALLTPEPTISRKLKEISLAFWAEKIYSKEEILEMYFNFVPYGGTAWGISAAAEAYFEKDVSDLNLAESAFLAGLPRAPSIYSPFIGDGESWKQRQKDVLDAMVAQNFISRAEADEAFSYKLEFSERQSEIRAPHFVMYVKDLLAERYGVEMVEKGGLQVVTSLDLSLQEKAEKIVSEHVAKSAPYLVSNGAALVSDPSTGDILAMVGSRDYFDVEHDGNVNVVRMLRQPGSTIKLITYALALESGYTESTILEDKPVTYPQLGQLPYKPVNYDGRYHGRVPLRYALANSYNIPAVKLAHALGPERIFKLGQRMGISSWEKDVDYGLSITLGGVDVTMIDLVQAYGVVANEGVKVELDPILEVRDAEDNVLYSKVPEKERVLSSATSYILSDILADNRARSLAFGANSPLVIPGRHVSVKTGTTDEKRDNWTIGFTPSYVAAVWVGNNDNSPMSPHLASGLTGAAPMWNELFSLLEDKSEISIPETVVRVNCNGQEYLFARGDARTFRCFDRLRTTL